MISLRRLMPVFLLAVGIFAQELPPEYREARQCYVQGQISEAVTLIRGALARRPQDLSCHLLYQELMNLGMGQAVRVRAEYDSLLALSPDDPALRFLAGRVQLSPYRRRAAAQTLVHEFPDFSYGWLLYGEALSEQRQRGRALEAFKRAALLDSNNLEAFFQWGKALKSASEKEAALRAFEQVLKLDFTRHEVRVYRLKVLDGLSETEVSNQLAALWKRYPAYKPLDDVLSQVAPVITEKFVSLPEITWFGKVYEFGDYCKIIAEKDAKILLHRGIEYLDRSPRSPFREYMWGCLWDAVLYRSGFSEEEKIRFLEDRIRREPWTKGAYNSAVLGYALGLNQDTVVARRLINIGLANVQGEERRWPLSYLGDVYIRTDRPAKALAAYAQARAASSEIDTELDFNMGKAAMAVNLPDSAMACYARALAYGHFEKDSLKTCYIKAYAAQMGTSQGAFDSLVRQAFASHALSLPLTLPNLTLVDSTGIQIALSDFKEPVLLISLWEPG